MNIEIDGLEIAAARRDPAMANGRPLIVTLHGGLYTSRYFDVPSWPGGSFLDLASQLGYATVSFDRPSYGASAELAPEQNTFERQAELLGAAIGEVAGDSGVVVVGPSNSGGVAGSSPPTSHSPPPLARVGHRLSAAVPPRRRPPPLAAPP